MILNLAFLACLSPDDGRQAFWREQIPIFKG